ncbi:MAG: sulfurtransferase [Ignavibacteria bacterium]|nr:sulfurtransferase [Ignavibacteria bacterium]
MENQYAHPETLVSTEWIDEHKYDRNIVIAEVDVDTTEYEKGHIPGAVGWNWQTELCDTVKRDIISGDRLEELLGKSGIKNQTTVILYGDNNNWFAAWAFWQLKLYGHEDVRLINGGRKKWLAEKREITMEIPLKQKTEYRAGAFDQELRAMFGEVKEALAENNTAMVDVRSVDEYTGKILSPAGLPETCQRGGHIPGAKSIPWATACNEDGTFRSFDELKDIYGNKEVTPGKKIIAYCRIGERSSHTWFVLKYLLGYSNVKNYDGSWTEWGNMIGVPVER